MDLVNKLLPESSDFSVPSVKLVVKQKVHHLQQDPLEV